MITLITLISLICKDPVLISGDLAPSRKYSFLFHSQVMSLLCYDVYVQSKNGTIKII